METQNETTAEDITTGAATYCPEDNCLRLYIGRVPRAEYLSLKADGWRALYKQREAGQGDFVATWTPDRHATALRYAGGVIDDEDAGPEERAADRAERFAGYQEKREGEAMGHADRYASGPAVHGFQNRGRAVRAADRHDKIAGRAVDAWETAEYWQRRTAGVISHRLHLSSPAVRMGRIKKLEAEQRKSLEHVQQRRRMWERWVALRDMDLDAEKQTAAVLALVGGLSSCSVYMHPRPETVTNAHIKEHATSLYTLMGMVERGYGSDDISGAEALALWFSDHSEPAEETSWSRHYALRLAYERQMLEAQGGRAGVVEMECGGWLSGGRRLSGEERQIVKVNKSNVSGRVVSVIVRDNRPSSRNHWGNPYPEGVSKTLLHTVEVERMGPDCYRAPTDEERAAFLETTKKQKAARKASAPPPIPLVNPTEEDAERLQAIWNERAADERAKKETRYGSPFVPAKVVRVKQATYSAASGGAYASAETRNVSGNGELWPRESNMYDSGRKAHMEAIGPAVCKVRITSGGEGWYTPRSVVIITDKPQKALPGAVWRAYSAPEAVPVAEDESEEETALVASSAPEAVRAEVVGVSAPVLVDSAPRVQLSLF